MALDTQSSETFWRVLGQGPRAALALHCNLGHSGAFRGVAAQLDGVLTIQAPDMPGHGRSAAYQANAQTGRPLLDAIVDRLDGPVDVIGHSYGALIALRLAVERPDLVRSLSLYEPVMMSAALSVAPQEVAANQAHMQTVFDCVDAGDPEAGVRHFVREWGDGSPWMDLPDHVRAAFVRQVAFVVATQPEVLQDSGNVMARLGEISVPTVVMDGAKSPAIMKPVCDFVAQSVQNGRRVTVEGAGHMGAISHPVQMADEIKKVLAKT